MGLLANLSPQRLKASLRKGRRKRPAESEKIPASLEESQGRALVRSVAGFSLGLVLAGAYGALVIFAQGYNIWYCLMSTLTLAFGLALGMAFSRKVRATVLLTMPQVFSREGKTMLLFLAFCLAIEGPFMNILRNFTRSAEAVCCGAELALNQTAEMVQRAKEPLLNALQKIKDIARKAKVVGDRVRKLFSSVMDAVKHVARCLRNVWYWLVHLGEICNQEMGAPYKKCVALFEKAKDECMRVVPLLFLFCYVVLLFKYLCGLANLLLVFCIIPNYIVPFLRQKVADPIVDVLKRIRGEFEFNLTTINSYDVTVNSSKSLSQVAFDIMEEVGARLQPAREAVGMFGYVSSFIILFIYVKALMYRKRYLKDDGYDNIYITRPFLEMDAMRRRLKRPTVLPLTSKESGRYIRPASLVLPRKEQLRYALSLVSICRQMMVVILLIAADYSIFWLFDLVRYQLQGEVVARAPVTMTVSVNGSGYSGEMYRDVVSSFSVLQQGNVSVLSHRCLLRPSEPDYHGYVVLGILYGICFFTAIFGVYIQRLQRVVCAWYYPSRERERISYLYNTILTRRTGLVSAILKAIRHRSADGGHQNILLIFAAKFPICKWLAKKLGVHASYCMGCGKIRDGEASEDFVTCSTPSCQGIYCPGCYQYLNNTCSVCMAPLTFQGDMDEEVDSSDEEAMGLWIGAVRALRGATDREQRRRRRELKAHIERVAKGEGGCRRLPAHVAKTVLAQLREEEGSGSSGSSSGEGSASSASSSATGSSSSSSSSSESESSLDLSYQKKAESSGSSSSSEGLEEVQSHNK